MNTLVNTVINVTHEHCAANTVSIDNPCRHRPWILNHCFLNCVSWSVTNANDPSMPFNSVLDGRSLLHCHVLRGGAGTLSTDIREWIMPNPCFCVEARILSLDHGLLVLERYFFGVSSSGPNPRSPFL